MEVCKERKLYKPGRGSKRLSRFVETLIYEYIIILGWVAQGPAAGINTLEVGSDQSKFKITSYQGRIQN
jgi:hypothetical protein